MDALYYAELVLWNSSYFLKFNQLEHTNYKCTREVSTLGGLISPEKIVRFMPNFHLHGNSDKY